MDFLAAWPDESRSLLIATATLLLSWLALRRRSSSRSSTAHPAQALDTVAGWPPEAARVINRYDRQALDLLRHAAPGRLVLAQVPLSRFLRVPTRHSYGEWLQRVGSLSADLLLCDSDGRVRVVVDIRAAQESARGRQRHERLARVLRAAGIHVCVWHQDAMPRPLDARSEIAALLPSEHSASAGSVSRPMPLIPVAEMAELLAEGDGSHFAEFDAALEPVPSAFFDDMETAQTAARR